MRKKLLYSLIILAFISFILIVVANHQVNKTTEGLVYTDLKKVPHQKVGLLLGTSKYLRSGNLNRYFTYRIDAAVTLFRAGKIDYIVISGDNSRKDYNEPEDMKNELIRQGVPAEKIYLDYAGFRTYDSVIRMNRIFGQQSFTIISQQFHNQRAVYIAHRLGLQAIAFNAKDVDAYNGFKTKLREKFARVKVFLDLLTNKDPKFLGEPVVID